MLLTIILFVTVMRMGWRWPIMASLSFVILFGLIECGFLGVNLFKILHGGWFALLAASIVLYLMTTWKAGRQALFEKLSPGLLPLSIFLEDIRRSQPQRVKGTAIFLSSTGDASHSARSAA
jgi:KUP system potassium uptake protein